MPEDQCGRIRDGYRVCEQCGFRRKVISGVEARGNRERLR